MQLSTAQLGTLKTWLTANASGVFDEEAAALLNALAAGPWIVWRSSVPVTEIMLNGFDWTRVDNLSVGKARIWDWMTKVGSIDPSKLNIRAGIDATWVGTQADLDVRAAVYVHCKRSATVGEKLFSTGTGTTAVPATMGVGAEGPVTASNVSDARNLP